MPAPDIYAVLADDHRRATDLLARLADAALDRPARTELLVELQGLLMAHHQVEETLLYGALAQHDETRALAAQALRQHEESEELLAVLSGARDGLGWSETLDSLRDSLGRHFALAESAIFSAARRHLDGKHLEQAIVDFRAHYDEATA